MKAYESSPGKRRWFCSVCGSPLYSERDAAPDVVRIRAGLLEEPVQTQPQFHFHVASKAGWWPIDDALAQHPGAAPSV